MSGPLDKETILNWFDYKLTTYFHWSAAAFLLYEYVLTFGDEMKYIWPSRWTLTKILYILSRYTPFLDSILVLTAQSFSVVHPHFCGMLYHGDGWVFLIGTAFTEVLLTLRTWAIWGRSRSITIALIVFALVLWAPMVYLMVLFQNAYNDFVILDACFVAYDPNAPPILWILFVLLMVYDTGLAVLMGIKAVQYYKNTRVSGRASFSSRITDLRKSKSLAEVMFRDGFMYYVFLFAFSAIQVGVSRTARAIVMNLLPGLHRVLHSALACRIVINIREQARQQTGMSEEITFVLHPISPHYSPGGLPPMSPGYPPSSPGSPVASPHSPGWTPLMGSAAQYQSSVISDSPISPNFKV